MAFSTRTLYKFCSHLQDDRSTRPWRSHIYAPNQVTEKTRCTEMGNTPMAELHDVCHVRRDQRRESVPCLACAVDLAYIKAHRCQMSSNLNDAVATLPKPPCPTSGRPTSFSLQRPWTPKPPVPVFDMIRAALQSPFSIADIPTSPVLILISCHVRAGISHPIPRFLVHPSIARARIMLYIG